MNHWFHLQSPSLVMGFAAFAAVLIENVLRSTQSKNVTAGYTKAVFFTGGLMTLCDGIVMMIIAKGGMDMLPFTVTASAIGWILGIKIHDLLTARHRRQLAEAKKARKKLKRERYFKKAFERALLNDPLLATQKGSYEKGYPERDGVRNPVGVHQSPTNPNEE